MRTYVFTYQDSTGLRHEGEVLAVDKDAAYASLRAKGIRAIRVTERILPVEKKGIAGLRKRDLFLIVIIASIVSFIFFFMGKGSSEDYRPEYALFQADITAPRHLIAFPDEESLIRLFPNPAHRFLCRYAVPGREVTVEESFTVDQLNQPIIVLDTDTGDVGDLKKVVLGMQQDAQRYLSSGRGINGYIAYIKERQSMERIRFKSVLKQVAEKKISYAEANDILRGMGLQERVGK